MIETITERSTVGMRPGLGRDVTLAARVLGLDEPGRGAAEPSSPCNAWTRHGDGRGVVVGPSVNSQWRARQAPHVDRRAVAVALDKDATARRVLAKGLTPADGAMVGVRLNLNILKSQGVCVHSLHRGGSVDVPRRGGGYWSGEVLDYRAVVTLRNAWFSVHQRGREAIVSGRQAKHPMASIDGELCAEDPCIDGVEARFNPRNTHLFVDGDGFAVRWAEHVTVVGHRAYARGLIVYHDNWTSPIRPDGAMPSVARLRER